MRELIHFAHGNGFPSACYRQLLNCLQTRYDCCFIDKLGHNPQFPVTENWSFLVEELIHSIEQQAQQPIIALGHSFGGVLSLLAAIKRPNLFKAVILLDSPLLNRFKSKVVQVAKYLGVIDRITPAARTRKRKEIWQTKEEIITYLRSRELFKGFTEACLQDYIEFGLEKRNEDYQLRFDRQIEYLIYRTLPHELAAYEGRLQVPAGLVYGDRSGVVDGLDIQYMKKYYKMVCHKIKGSHMFPMENPQEAARQIFQLSDTILS